MTKLELGYLEAEWHPTKNLWLSFSASLPLSQKYWWLGKCGHEWDALLSNRQKGQGCPVCVNRRILVGFNDLASQNPELAAEWHPTKNGKLTSQQITAGNNNKVWWLGKCGHEWEAVVSSRTGGRGCPACSGKKIIIGFNDLATTHPILSKEWHPTKNGKLTSQEISIGSNKMIWWLGKCGHEWDATTNSRKIGTSCPICSNHRILVGFNDLATINPVLAAEWHPMKNGELTPQNTTPASSKRVWWLGKCGHEWEALLSNRAKGNGCPVCCGKKIFVGFNDLASQHPEIARELHPTKNNGITARQVFEGLTKKIWWLCRKGHEWEATVTERTKRKFGCPFCSNQRLLSGFNDLATKNPILAAEWHPSLNADLQASQISAKNGGKFWWLGSCGHEWEAKVSNRSNGDNCPICSNQKVLAGFNDLATVNPNLAAEWHPTKNGQLKPSQIIAGTPKKIWWLAKCGHEWLSSADARIRVNTGCPVCVNKQIIVGFNDLFTINPTLAAEWHPNKNRDLIPQHVSVGSNKKVWWLGACGHEWETSMYSRSKGHGCNQCSHLVSAAETNIKQFIEGFGLIVEGSNRTILGRKEIDLWIPEKKVGIEFNGIYWHTEAWGKGRTYHYDKWNAAKKAGIQLIQIWEDDWNFRSEIIMRSLAHKLGVVKTEPVAGDTQIIAITEQQAKEFLTDNHLQGFAFGSHYLGAVEAGDIEKLKAVMVLDTEPNSADKSLEITRYASVTNVADNFSKLLSYAVNADSPESVTVIADHCEAEEELYESSGFIADKELPPDYMYVIRTERKPRSEYPIDRFRDDPNLLWEEGLTEMELADLNGLNRIWDAGKTNYKILFDGRL